MQIQRTIDLGHEITTPMEPVRKLVHLVLLIAIKDQASEIHLGKVDEDWFEIWEKVGGQLYEMVPPPAHLRTEIIHVLKRMGGFPDAEMGQQRQGMLGIRVRGPEVPALFVIGWNWYGERASLYLWPSYAASVAANFVLNRIYLPQEDDTIIDFGDEITS